MRRALSASACPASKQAEKDGHPARTFVVTVGNTRSRLTPEEARILSHELSKAAGDADQMARTAVVS